MPASLSNASISDSEKYSSHVKMDRDACFIGRRSARDASLVDFSELQPTENMKETIAIKNLADEKTDNPIGFTFITMKIIKTIINASEIKLFPIIFRFLKFLLTFRFIFANFTDFGNIVLREPKIAGSDSNNDKNSRL